MKTLLGILGLALLVPSLPALSHAAGGKPKIMFLRKEGKGFDDVHAAMAKELGRKYELVDFTLAKDTAYEAVRKRIREEGPSLMVLMDNPSVAHAVRYNSEQKDAKARVKGVALMGLNLKSALKGSQDFSGIAFESPAYTLLTEFRFIVQKPVKNVLVFYRRSLFQETIDTASKQLASEGISLQAVDVEKGGAGTAEVEAFLEENVKKQAAAADKFDVLWVLLDSAILNQKLFQRVWLAAAGESKIPFVTGAEELVSKNLNFATFAVTPNYPDLAGQALQQVEAQLTDRVAPRDLGVEDLISVNKVLNLRRARELGLKLREDKLQEVSRIE